MKEEEINILAFDLATKCGYASLKDGTLTSGSWRNPQSHSNSPGAFFAAYSQWLVEMLNWHRPEIVAWESTYGQSNAWRMMFAGMVTRIQEQAYRRNIIQASVPASTLKKLTSGNGFCGKDQMVAVMQRRWGWSGSDPDEADALAVLSWALTVSVTAETR